MIIIQIRSEKICKMIWQVANILKMRKIKVRRIIMISLGMKICFVQDSDRQNLLGWGKHACSKCKINSKIIDNIDKIDMGKLLDPKIRRIKDKDRRIQILINLEVKWLIDNRNEISMFHIICIQEVWSQRVFSMKYSMLNSISKWGTSSVVSFMKLNKQKLSIGLVSIIDYFLFSRMETSFKNSLMQ